MSNICHSADASWSLEEEEESAIREEYQRTEVVSAIKDEYIRPYKPYRHVPAKQFDSLVDANFNETAVEIDKSHFSKASGLGPSQVEDDVFNFGLVTRDYLLQRQGEFNMFNILIVML